eukprot:3816382-Lingulodinium_polyedra.AAC.1
MGSSGAGRPSWGAPRGRTARPGRPGPPPPNALVRHPPHFDPRAFGQEEEREGRGHRRRTGGSRKAGRPG